MNILFMANASFYNGLPLMLKRVCKDNGKDVMIWTADGSVPPFVKDPEVQRKSKEQYERILNARHYDRAVFIEMWHDAVSEKEAYLQEAVKAAAELEGRADEVILYEFLRFDGKDGSSLPDGHGARLTAATEEIAAAAGMEAVHVGTAFTGIIKNADFCLYEWDYRHMNYRGTVLAAMMLYKKIFGVMPENTDSMDVPGTILETLKEAAENV